jgi:hypothetical protein
MLLDWNALAPILQGAVSAGTSMMSEAGNYSVKIQLEVDNWTKWVLEYNSTEIAAGELSSPLIDILPLKREKMVNKFLDCF